MRLVLWLAAIAVALATPALGRAAPIVFNYTGAAGTFPSLSVTVGGDTLTANPVLIPATPAVTGLAIDRTISGIGVTFTADNDTQVESVGRAEAVRFTLSGSGVLESITFFTSGAGTGSGLEQFSLLVDGNAVSLASLTNGNNVNTAGNGINVISLSSIPLAQRTGSVFQIAPGDGDSDFRIQALAVTTPEPASLAAFGLMGAAGFGYVRRLKGAPVSA